MNIDPPTTSDHSKVCCINPSFKKENVEKREWYTNILMNEFQLTEIPDKRFIQNDVLYVKNLTKKESMVVQCNATNTHGSLFSDVYINVLGKSRLASFLICFSFSAWSLDCSSQ